MHVLLEIRCWLLYCYIMVGFGFLGTNQVAGIHRVWFWVWIITQIGVWGNFCFEFGFWVWVHDTLPNLNLPCCHPYRVFSPSLELGLRDKADKFN